MNQKSTETLEFQISPEMVALQLRNGKDLFLAGDLTEATEIFSSANENAKSVFLEETQLGALTWLLEINRISKNHHQDEYASQIVELLATEPNDSSLPKLSPIRFAAHLQLSLHHYSLREFLQSRNYYKKSQETLDEIRTRLYIRLGKQIAANNQLEIGTIYYQLAKLYQTQGEQPDIYDYEQTSLTNSSLTATYESNIVPNLKKSRTPRFTSSAYFLYQQALGYKIAAAQSALEDLSQIPSLIPASV